MHRRVLALLAIVFVSAPASRASACEEDSDCPGAKTCVSGECRQPPGGGERIGAERTGTVIVSAERLFGYTSTSSTTESKSSDVTATTTTSAFSVLFSDGGSAVTVPRVAVDVNVYSGLTLGGAAGYLSSTRATETNVGKGDGPEWNAWVLAPRLGWLTTSGRAGFWGRAGITYFGSKETAPAAEVKASGVSAQFEPTLLIAPVDHVMFSLALHFNVPLAGSVTSTETGTSVIRTEYDAKLSSFGATAGLHAWF